MGEGKRYFILRVMEILSHIHWKGEVSVGQMKGLDTK